MFLEVFNSSNNSNMCYCNSNSNRLSHSSSNNNNNCSSCKSSSNNNSNSRCSFNSKIKLLNCNNNNNINSRFFNIQSSLWELLSQQFQLLLNNFLPHSSNPLYPSSLSISLPIYPPLNILTFHPSFPSSFDQQKMLSFRQSISFSSFQILSTSAGFF